MDNHSKFMRKIELQRPADNMKLFVVFLLVLSLIVFQIMGDSAVKKIIIYWAVFMGMLVIACAIQDFLISKKIKNEQL